MGPRMRLESAVKLFLNMRIAHEDERLLKIVSWMVGEKPDDSAADASCFKTLATFPKVFQMFLFKPRTSLHIMPTVAKCGRPS